MQSRELCGAAVVSTDVERPRTCGLRYEQCRWRLTQFIEYLFSRVPSFETTRTTNVRGLHSQVVADHEQKAICTVSLFSLWHSLYHSVARQCLHRGMIDIIWGRGLELQNPWTEWQKIWRGWFGRRWLPACQNSKLTPHWGRGGA